MERESKQVGKVAYFYVGIPRELKIELEWEKTYLKLKSEQVSKNKLVKGLKSSRLSIIDKYISDDQTERVSSVN